MRKNSITGGALGTLFRTPFLASMVLAAMVLAAGLVAPVAPVAASAAAGACSGAAGAGETSAGVAGCWLSEMPPVPDPSRTLPAPAIASEAPVLPGPATGAGQDALGVPAMHDPVRAGASTSPAAGREHPPAGGFLFIELLGGGVAVVVAAIAVVGLWPTRDRRLTSR